MQSYFTQKNELILNNEELKALTLASRISKNIFNVALYTIRQEYEKSQKLLPIGMVFRAVRRNTNYKFLFKDCADAAIGDAYSSMSTYVRNLAKKLENLELPKYKSRFSKYKLTFFKPVIEENNGKRYASINPFNPTYIDQLLQRKYINDELLETFLKEANVSKIPNMMAVIPKNISGKTIANIGVCPSITGFKILYTYSDYYPKPNFKSTKLMAIDLGISNLATCATTDLETFIIDGRYLKSIIRLYDKKIAFLQSQLEKDKYISKQIIFTYRRKINRIDDYLNKAALAIFKEAKRLNVDTIIVGWNEDFMNGGIKNDKISDSTRKRINQMFIGVPLARFKNKILNKGKRLGVKVEIIEESYTSKASFFNNDDFYSESFSGERIERGLYKEKNGNIINADVNGALNIYRKYCYAHNSRYRLNDMMSRGVCLDPFRIKIKI